MKGSQSLKGIPENLKPLAQKGKRVRFAGGWLNDSQQDRFLANWIDHQPQAWTVIKHILYQTLTGGGIQINHQPQTDDYGDELRIGEAGSALLDFDD